jgi:hypothetical protein
LQGADYTADYRLYSVNPIPGLLEPKAWFHEESGAYYATEYVVDVKGAHQPPGSAAKFSLTQKILWHTNRVFANKVVIAYDRKKYSQKKAATSFFAMNGLPAVLPDNCYQQKRGKSGERLYYAVWERMFAGLPSIASAHGL